MQSTTMNLLLGMVAPPDTSEPNVPTLNAGEDALGQAFADLLNGAGGQAMEDSLPQFSPGAWLQATPASALAAQEVQPAPVLTDLSPNATLLSPSQRLITPQDAAAIIERIDQALRSGRNPSELQTLQQLKEQVARIAVGGTPKTVEQVIQSVAAPREARLSQAGLVALLTPPRRTDIPATPDHAQEEPTHAAELWQTMQAAMFRPGAREVEATPGTPRPQTKTKQVTEVNDADISATGSTVTVIVPLAASLTVEAAAPVETVVATAPSGLSEPFIPIPDLDEAIPPLSSGLEAGVLALPEVTLPSIAPAAAPTAPLTREEPVMSSLTVGAPSSQLASAADKLGKEITNTKDTTADTGSKESFADALAANADAPELASVAEPVYSAATQTSSPSVPAKPHGTTHAATLNLQSTPGYVNLAPVSEQVHVAIQKAAKDGSDRITIQLDPVDLGRVEVSMQANREGVTQIHFMIDKPETFDSLSRDARFLERALQEAGIKADTGSMQFNLRQQPQPQNLQADVNSQGQRQQPTAEQPTDKQQTSSLVVPAASLTNHYILNIREGVDISA